MENNKIEITAVNVFPYQGTGVYRCLGMATIVLNDCFLVRGLRIMDGENGLFVGYPQDPYYKGEDFRTLCNPLTRDLRERIENAVLEKYQLATMEG